MALYREIVLAGFALTQQFTRGSLQSHEIEISDDGHSRVVGFGRSVHSRRFYQRTMECASGARSTTPLQCRPIVANAFVDRADAGPSPQRGANFVERATSLARLRTLGPSGTNPRCPDAPRVSHASGCRRAAPDQRPIADRLDRAGLQLEARRSADGCHRFGGCLRRVQKKETQTYTAHRAGMGQRTFKTGQSRWYVGYKKHTLRLWWREHTAWVLLVPLVSWITPANYYDGALLIPSLYHCRRQWQWWPKIVVADMGYIAAELKAHCRTDWDVALVTRLRSDMHLVAPYVEWNRTECHQGQALRWLEYAPEQGQHWFGVAEPADCCLHCWEASACPRHFAFAANQHETLLGLLPLASLPAQRLLAQARPWIEPAQSYEKNQLGLSSAFLNSLRLTWYLALLADAAVLLRTQALLNAPNHRSLLHELLTHQSLFDFGSIDQSAR